MKRSTLALLLLAALPLAQAHSIWIETDAQEAKLYYGEFGQNLREAAPGRLDGFVRTRATLQSPQGDAARSPVKSADSFVLGRKLAKGQSLTAQDDGFAVTEKKEGDTTTRTARTLAARQVADFSAQAATLTLDIVPTGRLEKGEVEVQVLYQGKPLPKAKVELESMAGWAQNLRTDEAGKTLLALPWKGVYLVQVEHLDATAGERSSPDKGAQKYDVARFVSTLTLTQTQGVSSLPRPARMKPSPIKAM